MVADAANQTPLLEEAGEENLEEGVILRYRPVLASEATQEGLQNQVEEEFGSGHDRARRWERHCLSPDWETQEAWMAQMTSCE